MAGFKAKIPKEKLVLYFLVVAILTWYESSSNSFFIQVFDFVVIDSVYIIYFISNLLTSVATIFPEIIEGGTPGPGTVSCPV